jgi:glutamate racemase
MGREVVLVSSADETAFEVRRMLLDSGSARVGDVPATRRFLSSGGVEWFREQGQRLLGPELDQVEAVAWD